MSKYTDLADYDEYTLPEHGETIYQACCDCGLVHMIAWYRYKETGAEKILIVQDKRRTAQLRRYKNGDLHDGNGKWRLIRK